MEMEATYQYTWKNGVTICSKYSVGFARALQKDMIFVDLLTGDTYRVFSICKANGKDRDNLGMPEDVVQTFSAKPLSEEQLGALREKLGFQVDENLRPKEHFAILPTVG